MKFNKLLSLIIITLLCTTSCKDKSSNSNTIKAAVFEDAYLGQEPPGVIPKPFAPGIISTDDWEAGGVFTPDLKEFYLLREVGETVEEKAMKFMVYYYDKDEWKDSIISERVGQPFISPDGNILHLGRRYKARTQNGEWSPLKNLDSTLYNFPIMRLTASSKGTYVFDAMGEGLIRYAGISDGVRQPPVLFGDHINAGTANAHPFIAPDESYLLWDGRKEGGYGNADIYVSFKKKDGTWGEAINLGDQVNTSESENGARITPDGKYLFFNRNVGKVKPTDPYDDVNMYWVDAKVVEALRPNDY